MAIAVVRIDVAEPSLTDPASLDTALCLQGDGVAVVKSDRRIISQTALDRGIIDLPNFVTRGRLSAGNYVRPIGVMVDLSRCEAGWRRRRTWIGTPSAWTKDARQRPHNTKQTPPIELLYHQIASLWSRFMT